MAIGVRSIWAGLLLVLAAHAGMRFAGLFGPADWRPLVLASFLMLWTTPYIFLGKEDRRAIGLGRSGGAARLLMAFAVGALAALAVYWSAAAIFGQGAEHPFSSVRASYFSGRTPDLPPLGLFLAFTIPALIFSPVGEEFFCRGVIARIGEKQGGAAFGVFLSAAVFALLHVMHHGLFRTPEGWGYVGSSGLFWILQMFALSVLFSILRRWSGSIWAAVSAHAGFNLAMNGVIFTLFAGR